MVRELQDSLRKSQPPTTWRGASTPKGTLKDKSTLARSRFKVYFGTFRYRRHANSCEHRRQFDRHFVDLEVYPGAHRRLIASALVGILLNRRRIMTSSSFFTRDKLKRKHANVISDVILLIRIRSLGTNRHPTSAGPRAMASGQAAAGSIESFRHLRKPPHM